MRNLLKRKAMLLLAMLMLLPFVHVLYVTASPATRALLRELEAQQEQANRYVTQQQNLLAATRHEMSEVMLELLELEEKMFGATRRLNEINFNLLAVEVRIDDAEEELEIATEERDAHYEIFRARLREMHERGPVHMLDVLFRAESFSDFFMRLEFIRAVSQLDREIMEQLEHYVEQVDSTIEELERLRIGLVGLQEQELQQMQLIRDMEIEREEWFAQLEQDEERHAQFLAEAEYDRDRIRQLYVATQVQLAEEEEAERQRRIAAERAAAEAAHAARLADLERGPFAWPVPARTHVSSPFGPRPDPFTGRQVHHSGIDIPAPAGSRINAAQDGYVRSADWSNGGWGFNIVIDHAGGYSTFYAHNSLNRVVPGQRVTRGQHIADVGTTGRSTGNHLHFEIWVNDVPRNPMPYFGR